jgi:uncharacterized protein (TIGR02421 family)
MADKITKKFIADILQPIAAGRQVRRKLPTWGRVHIDRHLPFLCVYRHPAKHSDPGTERLLLGEAAYVLLPGGVDTQDSTGQLIKEITAIQAAACGGVLIIELWAGQASQTPEIDEHGLPHPTFRLIAPHSGVPMGTLDTLENALLEIRLRNKPAKVTVDYGKKCAPPGYKPLLNASEAKKQNAILLGIEVAPVYRNGETQELYPFALKALHHGIAHALKKTFYAFAHERTSVKPVHYLELGRRAITRAVKECDRRLAGIDSRFDLLLHVTPVNTQLAWHRFKRQRWEIAPEFHYRPRTTNPADLKRELYNIPLQHVEDPALGHLFEEKRDELDRKITMLGDRGTANFMQESIQVFGKSDEVLMSTAKKILACVPAHAPNDEPSHGMSAETFAKRANAEVDYYRTLDPKLTAQVQVRDDVTGLIVSSGNLLVGTDAWIGATRVEPALQHEVGTHMVTFYNGSMQPFQQLSKGLAGYDETQEGLAVLAEYLVGGLNRPRLRTLAGRVVAVWHLTGGAEFVETFRVLRRDYNFDDYTAYYITMRVYRGGGLTKDVVYLRGLIDLLTYLRNKGALEPLLVGKLALSQVPLIVELLWRKVLQPGLLRPRYLEYQDSVARLEQLQAGKSILDLAGDLAA